MFRSVALTLALAFCAPIANADPIIYTETATISGSLNGTFFSDSVLTLTGTPTSITFPAGCCFLSVVNLSFSVTGAGGGVFTDQTRVVSNQTNGSAGFGDFVFNKAILYTSNPAFSSYDLSTPIGPINGTAVLNSGFAFPTSGGSLIIYTVSGNSTFTAATAVPIPPAVLLFGSALSLMGAMRRKIET